jgi:hypothetical protein
MDPTALPGDDDSMSGRKMTGGRWNSSMSSPSSRSAEDLAGDGDGDAEPGSRSSGGVSKSSSRSNTCTAVVSAKLTRRERLRVSLSSSVPGDEMTQPRPPLPPKSMETGAWELGLRTRARVWRSKFWGRRRARATSDAGFWREIFFGLLTPLF